MQKTLEIGSESEYGNNHENPQCFPYFALENPELKQKLSLSERSQETEQGQHHEDGDNKFSWYAFGSRNSYNDTIPPHRATDPLIPFNYMDKACNGLQVDLQQQNIHRVTDMPPMPMMPSTKRIHQETLANLEIKTRNPFKKHKIDTANENYSVFDSESGGRQNDAPQKFYSLIQPYRDKDAILIPSLPSPLSNSDNLSRDITTARFPVQNPFPQSFAGFDYMNRSVGSVYQRYPFEEYFRHSCPYQFHYQGDQFTMNRLYSQQYPKMPVMSPTLIPPTPPLHHIPTVPNCYNTLNSTNPKPISTPLITDKDKSPIPVVGLSKPTVTTTTTVKRQKHIVATVLTLPFTIFEARRIWVLTESLGKGGCGHVYLANQSTTLKSILPKAQVSACKIVKEKKQFASELQVMRLLESHPLGPGSTPKLMGSNKIHQAIFMARLGLSVAAVFEARKFRFSAPAIVFLAMEMTRLVGEFQEKTGMVHIDMKPSNICLPYNFSTNENGSNSNPSPPATATSSSSGSSNTGVFSNISNAGSLEKELSLYLIDFSYSSPTTTRLPGQTGTPLFMAQALQEGGAVFPDERDDYESIGYVLMFFMGGGKKGLPWGNLKTHRDISMMKTKEVIQGFCGKYQVPAVGRTLFKFLMGARDRKGKWGAKEIEWAKGIWGRLWREEGWGKKEMEAVYQELMNCDSILN